MQLLQICNAGRGGGGGIQSDIFRQNNRVEKIKNKHRNGHLCVLIVTRDIACFALHRRYAFISDEERVCIAPDKYYTYFKQNLTTIIIVF